MKQWAKEHPEYKKQWKLDNPEKWKEMQKRAKFKREHNLGFVPLNEHFESADAHHIDTKHIIYMPKELHRSISHNVFTGKNMAEINAVAFNYLKDGESYQDVPTLSVAIHRIRPFQSMGN
ncbi:MAG: hypothetical protein NTY95_17615 [Bacteroidia bacterium]|nr:hypothetical protein [Bacteroidia bacterium]